MSLELSVGLGLKGWEAGSLGHWNGNGGAGTLEADPREGLGEGLGEGGQWVAPMSDDDGREDDLDADEAYFEGDEEEEFEDDDDYEESFDEFADDEELEEGEGVDGEGDEDDEDL